MDLGVIAMMDDAPHTLDLKNWGHHNQMQFSVIHKTPFFSDVGIQSTYSKPHRLIYIYIYIYLRKINALKNTDSKKHNLMKAKTQRNPTQHLTL